MGQRAKHDGVAAARALKLMAHPLRVRILEHLAGHGRASPRQIASDLDEPLGNVSYHVRALHSGGLITAAGTKPRRGAVEHFYKVADPDLANAARALVASAAALADRVAKP